MIKRKRAGVVFGAAAVATGMLLSACGGNGSSESDGPQASGENGGSSSEELEDVELRMTWWGGDARHEGTQAAIAAFEEKYPHISVVTDFGGFDGYLDKITTQYAGGNSPDVMQLYNEVIVEFADRDQLYDLNDAVTDGVLSLDGWAEDVIDMNTVNDKLVALTFGSNTHGFIFNETISEDLGVEIPDEGYSWEDLKTYSLAIAEASNGETVGTNDLAHGYQPFEVWAKQHGEEFLTADGIGFSAETLEGYWSYWEDMRSIGAVPSPDVSTEYQGTPFNAVVDNVTASTFIFINQFEMVTEATPDDLTILRMPGEGGTPGQYQRAAMNLAISSQSEHPKEAAMLVDFLLNSEEANAAMGVERGIPSNTNMFATATQDVNEIGQEANAIFESVVENGAPAPVPAPAGSAAVNTLFAEYAEEVQFGNMSVSEAVEKFLAEAESELG